MIETGKEAKRLLAEVLQISTDDVPADAEVGQTVGWDSIAHLELITAMEEYLDTEIPTEDALDISNLADVAKVLDKYG